MRAHVFGQPFLAWKAQIIVPRVAQEQRVDDFGVGGYIRVPQYEIRELCEPITRNWIGCIEPHVLLDFC